ncbi:hypothetical protein Tco_0657698 [Tanacetum coccineum]
MVEASLSFQKENTLDVNRLFFVHELDKMVMELGYTDENEPLFNHYLRLINNLDVALFASGSVDDVHLDVDLNVPKVEMQQKGVVFEVSCEHVVNGDARANDGPSSCVASGSSVLLSSPRWTRIRVQAERMSLNKRSDSQPSELTVTETTHAHSNGREMSDVIPTQTSKTNESEWAII